MTILVGRWDCPVCGHVGNLGPHTKCSQCGASRPENVQFYLPKDAEEVTDEQEIEKAEAGADWICSYCGGSNKIYEDKCKSCGNTHNATEGDKSIQEIEYEPDQVPDSGKKTPPPPPVPAKKPFKLAKGCLISIIAVFGIALVMFVLAMFTKETKVKVVGIEWERKINAERYQQVVEENWTLPQEGKLINSFTAIHHYDKILKGYETRHRTVQKKVGEERYVKSTKSLGNGNFKKIYGTRPKYKSVRESYQEPVYFNKPVFATKYKYHVFRWLTDDNLVTKGVTKPVFWFNNDSIKNTAKYRLIDSIGVYKITIVDKDGKNHTEEVNYEYWSKTDVGQSVTAIEASVYGRYVQLTDDSKVKK